MAWFGRRTEQEAAEAALMRTFYTTALAAADSYDVAKDRVEEGELAALFDRLRASHLDFAGDLKKRIKQLGADPEERTGLAEVGGRLITQINRAGSDRDLLIALRSGEENGVAMCREVLENADLTRKSRNLLTSYMQAHINNIRDLSEQIAIRGGLAETSAAFYGPQWLRYPKAGFWLLEGALVGLGYLIGRSKGSRAAHEGGS
jgi:hypothetical protein